MPLNLQIEIDPRSGFCFGVVNAIRIAEEYLQSNDSLYCLGDIVHNELEVKRLEALGMVTISYDQFRNLKDVTVLIRAHGEPPLTYRIAAENNLNILDASCSVVLKLQKKVKRLYDDHAAPMFIFGKNGHAEVTGLIGQIGDHAFIFQNLNELKQHILPEKIVLICQTTMDIDELYRIKDYLDAQHVEVEFNDTICRQVSNRNQELKDFVKKQDKVVFVAGRKSSNGKVLFDTCLRYNSATYFISGKDELNTEWFAQNDHVGICGATSTPAWLIQEVKEELEKF